MLQLEHVGRAQHADESRLIDDGQVMQRILGEQAQRLGDRLVNTDRQHGLAHDASNALFLHGLPRSHLLHAVHDPPV